MTWVLRALRELVEDAEGRAQPLVAQREFVRLRAEVIELRADLFAGPADRGEVAELTRRATSAGLYHPERFIRPEG